MTVKDMISLLKDYDQELQVCIPGTGLQRIAVNTISLEDGEFVIETRGRMPSTNYLNGKYLMLGLGARHPDAPHVRKFSGRPG